MKQHLEKNLRIISDLMVYYYSLGATECHTDLKFQDGVFYIHLSAPVAEIRQGDLDDLHENLNLPRQHEIEQSYWELSGDNELESELTLVGMMTDEAKVEYSDGVLSIHLKRSL